MPFIDYETLLKQYPEGQMFENVCKLREFDMYHCLLLGSLDQAQSVKKMLPNLPDDFLKWLSVCGGGLLFDTILFTIKPYDETLDLHFDTYNDLLDDRVRQGLNLSKHWGVFAEAVHGDVYFYDLEKKDGQIYQWDTEELCLYTVWDSFEEWLTEQIEEAIEEIAIGNLTPMGIKIEDAEDE